MIECFFLSFKPSKSKRIECELSMREMKDIIDALVYLRARHYDTKKRDAYQGLLTKINLLQKSGLK